MQEREKSILQEWDLREKIPLLYAQKENRQGLPCRFLCFVLLVALSHQRTCELLEIEELAGEGGHKGGGDIHIRSVV